MFDFNVWLSRLILALILAMAVWMAYISTHGM